MEKILSNISKNDLRELLTKGWMTHDAMWLYHCLQECGIEKANIINTAAVTSMSVIEISRVKKALGYPKEFKIETFDQLFEIMKGAMALIKADFMEFKFSRPKNNILHWEWEKESCFAYEGVSNLGIIDQYQCGIMLRIEGWLKGLGIKYEIDPKIDGCLMKSRGFCEGDIIISL